MSLLWAEYCEECRTGGKTLLMYSQFCHHYRQYRQKTKATMHILSKPGEQIEVDWAGKTAGLTDSDTGDVVFKYLHKSMSNLGDGDLEKRLPHSRIPAVYSPPDSR